MTLVWICLLTFAVGWHQAAIYRLRRDIEILEMELEMRKLYR